MNTHTVALIFIVLLLGGFAVFLGSKERFQQSGTFKAGEYSRSAYVSGVQRAYSIYVPESYNDRKPGNAAVIVLHGGGESAKYIMAETGWADKDDKKGFLAVFPEGTRPDPAKPGGLKVNQQTWKDGAGRFYHHEEQNIDDIAFLEKIIDTLLSEFGVDTRRIFMTGFSEILETAEAFELGAKGFLNKPFQKNDILNEIRRCLGENHFNLKRETRKRRFIF